MSLHFYNALGIRIALLQWFQHTQNHMLNYLKRTSEACDYYTPVFHMPKPETFFFPFYYY